MERQYSAWLNDTGLVEVWVAWKRPAENTWENDRMTWNNQLLTQALAFDNTLAVKDITGGAVQEARSLWLGWSACDSQVFVVQKSIDVHWDHH